MHQFELNINNEIDVCNDWRKIRCFFEQTSLNQENIHSEIIREIIAAFNTNKWKNEEIDLNMLVQFLPSRQYKNKYMNISWKEYSFSQSHKSKNTVIVSQFIDFLETNIHISFRYLNGKLDRKSPEAMTKYIEQIKLKIYKMSQPRKKLI